MTSSTTSGELSILLAEDNPVDAELLEVHLDEAFKGAYHIDVINSYAAIEEKIQRHSYDTFILDKHLTDGFQPEHVKMLTEKYPDLPIIVLTGLFEKKLSSQLLEYGAQDYLSKDQITPISLEKCIRYARERKAIDSKLRKALTEERSSAEKEAHLARIDILTNIPNRCYFEERLLEEVHRCQKYWHGYATGRSMNQLYLIILDLNDFKPINDSLGHDYGDGVLRGVADRLKSTLSSTDFSARIGGDEFAILCRARHQNEIINVTERLCRAFHEELEVMGQSIGISVAMGVAELKQGESSQMLLQKADSAMYRSKRDKLPICMFDTEMSERLLRKQQLIAAFKDAVDQDLVDIRLQPIVSAIDKQPAFYEVLMQWDSSLVGHTSPGEVIPLVEKGILMDELLFNQLHRCAQLKGSLPTPKSEGHPVFSINISPYRIYLQDFVDSLLAEMERSGLEKHDVVFEVTEYFEGRSQLLLNAIHEMDQKGLLLALDDLGSGNTSIKQLLECNFRYVKIDMSLLHKADKSEQDRKKLQGIVDLVHHLPATIIAEGVESSQQDELALDLGFDLIQGFYYHRPGPPEAFKTPEPV